MPNREWRLAHPGQDAATSRRYYAAHRDVVRERSRQRYLVHREEILAYERQRRMDPEVIEKHRNAKYRRNHGLSLEQVTALIQAQEGLCAICHQPFDAAKHTHVDHDHESGQVRGILCNRCNLGLGHFRDNPDFLAWAVTYLAAATFRAHERGDVTCQTTLQPLSN